MSEAKPDTWVPVDQATLDRWLTELRLIWNRERLDQLLQTAVKHQLSHRDTIALLLQAEIREKKIRRIDMRLKQARFPSIKTLDNFDFAAQASIDPQYIQAPQPPTKRTLIQ